MDVLQTMNTPRRVVVTGYGAVTPLGMNSAESWAAIMAYKLGYRPGIQRWQPQLLRD